jgi:hypothetical protein
MQVIPNPRIWEFDVDDTLICWDLSQYPDSPRVGVPSPRGGFVEVIPHQKNINLLVKLSKIGWYIRVHSGSGVNWASDVIKTLQLEDYVDSVESKPLGKTDDQPPGDGLAYQCYRDPA